jgi:hypothetical protein
MQTTADAVLASILSGTEAAYGQDGVLGKTKAGLQLSDGL